MAETYKDTIAKCDFLIKHGRLWEKMVASFIKGFMKNSWVKKGFEDWGKTDNG